MDPCRRLLARSSQFILVLAKRNYPRAGNRSDKDSDDILSSEDIRKLRENVLKNPGEYDENVMVDAAKPASDSIRHELGMNKMIKRKMLEKKHFKKPVEPNLLTWSAKEQLKYLHDSDPEQWTVDKLAESFPTSKEGVIRLLKSKWVPRTTEQLAAHDDRVRKNWDALRRQGGPSGGPIIPWQRLQHAAGNDQLPKPARLPEPEQTVKKSGPFMLLIGDLVHRETACPDVEHGDGIGQVEESNRQTLRHLQPPSKAEKG